MRTRQKTGVRHFCLERLKNEMRACKTRQEIASISLNVLSRNTSKTRYMPEERDWHEFKGNKFPPPFRWCCPFDEFEHVRSLNARFSVLWAHPHCSELQNNHLLEVMIGSASRVISVNTPGFDFPSPSHIEKHCKTYELLDKVALLMQGMKPKAPTSCSCVLGKFESGT